MWPPEIECGQPRGAVGAGIPRREDWPQFCRDWDDAHKPTEVKAQHMLGAAPGDPSYRNFSRETAHHRSSLLADVLHVKFASPHRTTRIGVPGGEAVDFKSLKTIFMGLQMVSLELNLALWGLIGSHSVSQGLHDLPCKIG